MKGIVMTPRLLTLKFWHVTPWDAILCFTSSQLWEKWGALWAIVLFFLLTQLCNNSGEYYSLAVILEARATCIVTFQIRVQVESLVNKVLSMVLLHVVDGFGDDLQTWTAYEISSDGTLYPRYADVGKQAYDKVEHMHLVVLVQIAGMVHVQITSMVHLIYVLVFAAFVVVVLNIPSLALSRFVGDKEWLSSHPAY